MKSLLKPRFNKRQVISVQYTSNDGEEDNRSKELESDMYQIFDNIDQRLRQILDIAPRSCIYNSINKEENNSLLFPEVEVGETSEKQARCNGKVLIEQEKEIVEKLNKKKVMDEDTGGSMMKLKQDKENK